MLVKICGVSREEDAMNAMERKERDNFFMQVDFNDFDNLVQRWVKTSKTRTVNWFEKDDNYHMIISTPDNNYLHVIPKNKLSLVKKADWLDPGRKIEKIVSIEDKSETIPQLDFSKLTSSLEIEMNKKIKAMENTEDRLNKLLDNIETITKMDSVMQAKLSELDKVQKKIEDETKKLEKLNNLKEELKGEL